MTLRGVFGWVGRGLFLLLLLVCTLGGGLVLWLRTSLPQTTGRIVVPGLSAAVEVTRGAAGVPHIVAANADDAAFALGFVHAQDRMFQMDLMRRYGEGRISELAGKATLGMDRFMRTLGLAEAAKRQLAALPPPLHQLLEAYAAGVNAWIAQHSGAKPFFYYFVPGPAKWRPLDTLVIGKIMALYLSQNFRREIEHALIAARVPPERFEELFPPRDLSGFSTLAARRRLFRKLPLAALSATVPAMIGQPDASNDWVVDGKHSVTGKPILENDPHLTFTAPSIWYLAEVKYGDLDLTGGTIPGTPFLVVGHNGHVGWGYTETGSDVEDLFIEKLDPQHPDHYLAPGGSLAFATRRETIHVKGAPDDVITVRSTRHGPVISDVMGDARAIAPGSGYVVALEANFLQPGDQTPEALWGMETAHDWQEFDAALAKFGAPEMNIVYADTGGTIAFAAPARVPIRKHGDGWMPAPGWTGEYDWTGYIPFDKLPHGVDPPDGRFVSANNKIVPDNYPYFLSRDWALPARAERITALLKATPVQSLDTTAAIAGDTLSLAAKNLLPVLLQTIPDGPRSQVALGILRRWDARMDRGEAAPLIFVAWVRELNRELFEAALGKEFNSYWRAHPEVLRNILTKDSDWCGKAPPAGRLCAAILSRSLETATEQLAAAYGNDVATWRWGEAHRADFRNPVLSRVPLLGSLVAQQIPASGGSYTVNAGDMTFSDTKHPYRDRLGPGLRMILDFADLSRSRFIVSPGMSANPFSAHYGDLLQRWRDVGWLDIGRARGVATLTLAPR